MSRAVAAGAVTGMTFILLLAAVQQVQAHNRSQSYSTWKVSASAAEMVFTVRAREVTRLPPLEGGLLTLEALLTAHLGETVAVTSIDGASCVKRGEPRALAAAEGYLRVRARFDCKAGPPLTLLLDSFFAIAPSHVHYARVLVDGQLPGEYLFTDSSREHAIAPASLGTVPARVPPSVPANPPATGLQTPVGPTSAATARTKATATRSHYRPIGAESFLE